MKKSNTMLEISFNVIIYDEPTEHAFSTEWKNKKIKMPLYFFILTKRH